MKPFAKTLLFILALVLPAAVTARAESVITVLFDAGSGSWSTDYSQRVASVNGTLYIARADGLYSYRTGDEAPKQLMDFAKTDLAGSPLPESKYAAMLIAELLSENGTLYALDTKLSALWRFDESAAAFVKEASFDAKDILHGDISLCSGFTMDGGHVYYIGADEMTGARNLWRLDPDAGHSAFVCPGISLIAPYAPGTLLAVTEGMRRESSLGLLSLPTGRVEEKLALDARYEGLHYDPATDTAYLARSGEVQAIKSFAPPVAAARMPIMKPAAGGALLDGGYLAIPYRDGVRILSTNPGLLTNAPLTILGQTWDLPMTEFSQANPDITFKQINTYPATAMDLILHMMGGGSAADVYVLHTSGYNLAALYEKGYFADLSQSEAVQSVVSAMYPCLKDACLRGGQTAALPFAVLYTVGGYNPQAFDAAGFTEQDVPKTYGELIDFVDRWPAEYAQMYPALSPFGTGAEGRVYKRVLARLIMNTRRMDCLRRGEPVTYDTPEMRTLMDKLYTADFSAVSPASPAASEADSSNTLFHAGIYVDALACNIGQFSYMPLSLFPGTQPVVLADAQVLLINPYTKNGRAAMAFLEFVAGSLPAQTRASLMPGENEPVRDPAFDLEMVEKSIEGAKKALAKAKEEDKRIIQDSLNDWLFVYENRAEFEWLVSPQSLAALRALDPYFMLLKADAANGTGGAASPGYVRFLDGQATLDQFLREMDQMERMIEKEN